MHGNPLFPGVPWPIRWTTKPFQALYMIFLQQGSAAWTNGAPHCSVAILCEGASPEATRGFLVSASRIGSRPCSPSGRLLRMTAAPQPQLHCPRNAYSELRPFEPSRLRFLAGWEKARRGIASTVHFCHFPFSERRRCCHSSVRQILANPATGRQPHGVSSGAHFPKILWGSRGCTFAAELGMSQRRSFAKQRAMSGRKSFSCFQGTQRPRVQDGSSFRHPQEEVEHQVLQMLQWLSWSQLLATQTSSM